MFNNTYKNRNVLITGHTGFKGSWLALWLLEMGAKITGYSLDPPSEPNHFNMLKMNINSITGDIRDYEKLRSAFKENKPDIIFHLAAQPIVRHSYSAPIDTFSSNVMGTINVFEASRATKSVKAIINVTSDKCYENREWIWGYREIDPLGGFDPYSASKSCAELITNCWRNSFFNLEKYNITHCVLLASCRAGNVIGGGDWADDRLVPDIARSLNQNEKVKIRNPHAIRPWQHVLEPLSGYLLLGQKLLEGNHEFAESWNFGPLDEGNATVGDIVDLAGQIWPQIDVETELVQNQPHEAGMLKLDCSKSSAKLRWTPVWDLKTSVEKTFQWYRSYYESQKVKSFEDIHQYILDAKNKKMPWVKK